VDPNTRRDALENWRNQNAVKPLLTVLQNRKSEFAFVGDNVNVYVNVRDVTAGVFAKQLNMFATAAWLRVLPVVSVSKVAPLPVTLSFRLLMLDAAGYDRVFKLLSWAVRELLLLRKDVSVDTPNLERSHIGQIGASTWIPFYLCERDSSRPAEMLEILKELVSELKLDRTHEWPFYGDMLTCRNVVTASAAYGLDSALPARLQAEFGLFHCQMAVIQRLLFKHFGDELGEAAVKLGLKTKLKAPEKNYNVFEHVCTGSAAT
jgi:hypothetical protein